MAALDFTDRSAVLSYLESQLPDADAGVLEALLDASAGESCAEPPVITYRPFWVEADFTSGERSGEIERARGASGSEVAYRDTNQSRVRALLTRQAALDKALCSVPPGFEAHTGAARSKRVRTVF